MSHRIATCCCGSLKVTCDGDPTRVSLCHCLECQKRTGSAFAFNARFRREMVRVEGQTASYMRSGDSGQIITFRFCPTCGSTVYWTLPAMPAVVAVAAGCFADSSFLAPRISVYERSMHAWIRLPETIGEHIA